MKLAPVICVAMALAGCCHSRLLTQKDFWTKKQYIAAIDQDPGLQDAWIRKHIFVQKQGSTDTFLVTDRNGNRIKRK